MGLEAALVTWANWKYWIFPTEKSKQPSQNIPEMRTQTPPPYHKFSTEKMKNVKIFA